MSLASEIAEQPVVAARLIGPGREAIDAIADRLARRLRDRDVDAVVIAARGTSDHAAIYAQYLFGARLRLPVALATPSLLSIYGIEPRLDRSLVVGVSQSGRSPDIVGVVAAARRQGGPTIAITNDPASDLATAAEHTIDLGAGPELAVAATKTYTAELVAIAMLVTALERATAVDRAALDAVPDAIATALTAEPQAEALARHVAASNRDRLIVVGRGYEYATARELALKLKELARVAADPYSAADFLHGPLALAEPGHPILIVAPSGAAAHDVDELIARLRDLRVELLVLSDRADVVELGPVGIRLPAGVPDWLMPIVSIVPGQLLARHLAIARGLDPEAPRWIGKVTLTR